MNDEFKYEAFKESIKRAKPSVSFSEEEFKKGWIFFLCATEPPAQITLDDLLWAANQIGSVDGSLLCIEGDGILCEIFPENNNKPVQRLFIPAYVVPFEFVYGQPVTIRFKKTKPNDVYQLVVEKRLPNENRVKELKEELNQLIEKF